MITVFYDGKCGLCCREIEHYKHVAPQGVFIWQDITTDAFALETLGITYSGQLTKDDPISIIRYELHIANDPLKFGKAVAYEALSYAPNGKFRKIFEREEQKFSFGRESGLTDNDPRIQSIRPNASII